MQSIKVRCPTLPEGSLEWGTSFGRVEQHHIRRKIVNVRGKKDEKSVFVYLVNYF